MIETVKLGFKNPVQNVPFRPWLKTLYNWAGWICFFSCFPLYSRYLTLSEQVSFFAIPAVELGKLEAPQVKLAEALVLPPIPPPKLRLPKRALKLEEVNKTREATRDVLVFTGVPLAASGPMAKIMEGLSLIRGFEFIEAGVSNEEDDAEKQEVFEMLRATIGDFSAVAISGLPYHDLHSQVAGKDKFIFVSMVRDPVERIISWYYTARSPWFFIDQFKQNPADGMPDIDWALTDFETCMEEKETDCQWIPGTLDVYSGRPRQTSYFCNMNYDAHCKPFNGPYASQVAKKNVNQHFAVVGVVEDFEMTLEVLEKFIPRFFQGARAYYAEHKRQLDKAYRNWYKSPVADKYKAMVAKNLTEEIKFYEYCRMRLYRQYQALQVHGLA